MKWRRLNEYAIRSTCGRWQISRMRHGEHDLYTLWRRDPESTNCSRVQNFQTAGAARQRAADEDARRAQGTEA